MHTVYTSIIIQHLVKRNTSNPLYNFVMYTLEREEERENRGTEQSRGAKSYARHSRAEVPL